MAKNFLKNICFKYKVSILKETTFEEVFHFKLSPLVMFIHLSFFTLIAFAIISLLIFLTPIKQYLPGYADVSAKGDLIKESMRIDSLQSNIESQNRQFDMMKLILRDQISYDSITTVDSTTIKSWKDLPLEKSEKESQFVEEYKKDAKYNLSSIDVEGTMRKKQTNIFISPANGLVTESKASKNLGIDIITSSNTAVIAIAEGTIIHTHSSLSNGYMVMIQHKNGFMSIYSNIERLIKKNNDRINTGEVIGFVSNTKKKNTSALSFELWLNGEPVKPADYIVF